MIDFGSSAVGDPAYDLVVAWTEFSGDSRAVFRARLPFDDDTWRRARGWALWKALITAADSDGDQWAIEKARKIIVEVIADHRRLRGRSIRSGLSGADARLFECVMIRVNIGMRRLVSSAYCSCTGQTCRRGPRQGRDMHHDLHASLLTTLPSRHGQAGRYARDKMVTRLGYADAFRLVLCSLAALLMIAAHLGRLLSQGLHIRQ